jgi:ketosteroid isomerase-like protein
MSEENVELARRLYEEAGDLLHLTGDQIDDAFREVLHDQFEFRLPPDYPEGELVFRGRDGVSQLIAMLTETWVKWQFQSGQFVDAGDQVVVFGRIVGEGRGSGVPFEIEITHVLTIHGGRIESVQAYRDRSAAFEAAGLSE